MKNWKTSLAAFLAILVTVAHAVWPKKITLEVMASINTVLGALGLAAAKDHDVTGGSVTQ